MEHLILHLHLPIRTLLLVHPCQALHWDIATIMNIWVGFPTGGEGITEDKELLWHQPGIIEQNLIIALLSKTDVQAFIGLKTQIWITLHGDMLILPGAKLEAQMLRTSCIDNLPQHIQNITKSIKFLIYFHFAKLCIVIKIWGDVFIICVVLDSIDSPSMPKDLKCSIPKCDIVKIVWIKISSLDNTVTCQCYVYTYQVKLGNSKLKMWHCSHYSSDGTAIHIQPCLIRSQREVNYTYHHTTLSRHKYGRPPALSDHHSFTEEVAW